MYVSRFAVLRKAYAAWRSQCAGLHGCSYYYPDDYYAFTLANEDWLDDYALYMALKTANKMKNWVEWDAHTGCDKAVLAAFSAANEEEIGFWKFVQYKFGVQWAAESLCQQQGHPDHGRYPHLCPALVDAWVGGPLFELEPRAALPAWPAARRIISPPTVSSGATRSTTGSTTARLAMTGGRAGRHALGIYDLLRIDHFRGFDTYWAIPADSTPPRTASGRTAPAWSCSTRWKALGKLPIIAEDLGDMFPSVRKLLADSGFPGMKVLQFAFSGGDNEYLPHNHVKNSVVYPGTHDNTTLTAWWEIGAVAKEKAMAAAYLHLTGAHPTAKEVAAVKTEEARVALLRAALGSVAERAIIPMYDWLGLGEEAT